ncbi:hypothetical protein [Maribacter sp. LLG6340-A2]|uniref:hypothetical protein n=1 Tax=Maribacter sp. LLG6340-A2 TaxID=3160834 RepID=UPI00386F049A
MKNKECISPRYEKNFTLDADIQIHSNANKKDSSFSIKESADKSKLLLFESNVSNVFTDNSYKITIFDINLNILWDKEFGGKDVSIHKEHFYTASIKIGNDGSVYMTGRKYLGKKHTEDKKAFNGYSIKRIYKDEKIKSYDLPFEESIVYRLGGKFSLVQNNENDNLKLVVLQMKSNGKLFYHFEIVELTQQLELVNKNIIKPTKENFLELTEKQKKNKNWVEDSQKEVVMRKVKILPNNDLVIVTENGSPSTFTTSKFTGNAVTDAKSRSIFVYKFNEENQLSWIREIPKNQSGTDYNVGFVWKVYDKNQFFVFNDTEKNYLNKESRVPKYNGSFLSNNILKAVRLNNDTGDMEESIVFKLDDEQIWAYLSSGYGANNYLNISHENLLFMGNKKKKFKLINLNFKN